jgi:RHS repeat-associated protein
VKGSYNCDILVSCLFTNLRPSCKFELVLRPFRTKPLGSVRENERESENCHNYRTDPFTAVSQILSEDGPWSSDTVTYGYTDQLRTSLSLQQPTGSWTNGFAYDAAKRLTNVTSQAGSFGYSYGPTRQMLPESIALPNTSYISNVYDGSARVLTITLYNSAGATLDAAEYGYNVGNQRTAYTNAAGTHVGYTYDAIGQLTVANSSVSSENRGYLYDAAWNLNRLTNNGVATTFSVNSLNELTGVGSTNVYYDGNGNLTNKVVTTHSTTNIYDDENRLIWVSTATISTATATSFYYDGLGRLREQVQWSANGGGGQDPLPTNGWTLVGGIAYIYDGNRVIQERDLNNNPLVSYTRGNDLSGSLEGAGGIGGLLARSDGYSSGTFSDHNFYHGDGNGNITYLVNSSQTLAASYRYDPCGNLISSSGTLAPTNTYRFSSKEFIPNAGIYYYLYRFYDPSLQRWMNRDPFLELGFEVARNASLNRRYLFTLPSEFSEQPNLSVFVRNDPEQNVDPIGLALVPGGGTGTRRPPGSGNKGSCNPAACASSGGQCMTVSDAYFGGNTGKCIRNQAASWPGLVGGVCGAVLGTIFTGGNPYGGIAGGFGGAIGGAAVTCDTSVCKTATSSLPW